VPYFASPVDAVRLHYVDYGPADGPVLFFVNSAYLGAEMWEFQMLPLAAEGYSCVGFDRRGHGRSEDTWSGFDLDSLADDLHGLLELLDLREVTLVGHSMGSVEIVRCLTRHGAGRVVRVVFVGGIAPGVVRSADNPDGLDPDLVRGANEQCRRDRAAFFAAGVDAFFAVDRPGNDVSASYRQYVGSRPDLVRPLDGRRPGTDRRRGGRPRTAENRHAAARRARHARHLGPPWNRPPTARPGSFPTPR